ncbi:hypothetical protein F4802DRAFT_572995 [Xylaria palmicola]|nr:hypothetical protein F4802DRAFT_572995 [Xylaria palmicola]
MLTNALNDPTSLSRLETLGNDLAKAVQTLVTYRSRGGAYSRAVSDEAPANLHKTSIGTPDPASEAHQINKSILRYSNQIRNLVQQPADFLQQLATQNQLLACLRWLGEFQVLAFIPLHGSVSTQDVADLAGMPEAHLSRVVQMTVTAGFLRQPQPGQVAHTALSASFVTNPSLLDAVLFLSEVAAPTALQMAAATQNYGISQRPDETAYNLTFHTPNAFSNAYEQRPRLQRQWPAYLRFGMGDFEASAINILSQYPWNVLDGATVVEVGSLSTVVATALVALYPSLRFVVQMSDPTADDMHHHSTLHLDHGLRANKGITIQQRSPGALQTVVNASVYIIHLPAASPTVTSVEVPARIVAELRAHIGILRANRRSAILLVTSPLGRRDGVSPDVEAAARLRDLSKWQLANCREIEMTEITELLSSVRDNLGKLAVTKQFMAPDNAVIALEVQYQINTER